MLTSTDWKKESAFAESRKATPSRKRHAVKVRATIFTQGAECRDDLHAAPNVEVFRPQSLNARSPVSVARQEDQSHRRVLA
jgi:hypothetical protein